MSNGKVIKLSALISLSLLLAPDFVLFDWWRVTGRVAHGNEPIPHAAVLAIVQGSEFQPTADSGGLGSVCIGTAAAQADDRGHFEIDERHKQTFLARKRVYLFALAEGYVGYVSAVPLPVAFVHAPVEISVSVRELNHDRWSYARQSMVGSDVALLDGTVSHALLLLGSVLRAPACGPEGWEYLSKAFDMSLSFVANENDKAFVQAACQRLQERAKSYAADPLAGEPYNPVSLFSRDCAELGPSTSI